LTKKGLDSRLCGNDIKEAGMTGKSGNNIEKAGIDKIYNSFLEDFDYLKKVFCFKVKL